MAASIEFELVFGAFHHEQVECSPGICKGLAGMGFRLVDGLRQALGSSPARERNILVVLAVNRQNAFAARRRTICSFEIQRTGDCDRRSVETGLAHQPLGHHRAV